MRIRATVAAVSGALALSAFAVPAAHADGSTSLAETAKALAGGHAASGRAAFGAAAATATTAAEPYVLDASFSDVSVGKGKNIVVGTTKTVQVPVSFTLNHAADVDIAADDFVAAVDLYRGSSFENADYDFSTGLPACTATSDTVASCTSTAEVDPAELINEDAGTWKVAAFAVAFNGQDPSSTDFDITKIGVAVQDGVAPAFKLQRYSKLTVNASPEPVKKGKTITVNGALTRANWDSGTYSGYTSQSVKLQFKKKGSTTYTTVKTIKSGSAGALKTTVKASVDGYFRYSFAGTSTTPAVNATGDYVDVK